jgi:hypothetical protein
MIKKFLLHITRVISAGWCAECWLGGAWLLISGAFNNKSVHFVGVINVWLSTCTEGQQFKKNYIKTVTSWFGRLFHVLGVQYTTSPASQLQPHFFNQSSSLTRCIKGTRSCKPYLCSSTSIIENVLFCKPSSGSWCAERNSIPYKD